MSCERKETLLSVEDVNLKYGTVQILRDVNIEIKNLVRSDFIAGQVVAFLGPSGAGKTSLLRILAGLQKPTSGNVLIGPERKPVHAGIVGMVSQKYYLYQHRTVMSNLMVAAKQKGINETTAVEVCTSMLAKFDLADKGHLYPIQLSGGQQQRVAIAQQLLCSDHLLLMDEPTAGLDVVNKNRVAKLITEIANQDDLNTIIIVTHDIPSALAVADTVWLLGRDRDVNGNIIPGARIVDQYDLIERGLMWHPEVRSLPEFGALVSEIESRFKYL